MKAMQDGSRNKSALPDKPDEAKINSGQEFLADILGGKGNTVDSPRPPVALPNSRASKLGVIDISTEKISQRNESK